MRVTTKRLVGATLALAGLGFSFFLGRPDVAATELANAREAFTAGRFDEAYERYREVTLVAPGSEPEAAARYAMASIAYLRWRDHNEARAHLRVLIRDTPESPVTIDGRLLLARIHAEAMNQPRKALQEYRQLRNDDGSLSSGQFAEASLGVATLEDRLGRTATAQPIYEQVWRTEGVDQRYRDEAADGLVRIATRRGELGRVRELLRERLDAVQNASARLELMCRLIDAELSSDAFTDADASLRLAEASFPSEARIQKRRDHLSELLGNKPRAISALELKRLQDGIPWSIRRRGQARRAVSTTEQ